MKENDFNFVSKNISKKDLDLFLGPTNIEEETFIEIEDRDIMANLIAKIGVFPSISQARKNGWNKPIPLGFSEFKVGKRKIMVSILNLTEKE